MKNAPILAVAYQKENQTNYKKKGKKEKKPPIQITTASRNLQKILENFENCCQNKNIISRDQTSSQDHSKSLKVLHQSKGYKELRKESDCQMADVQRPPLP